MYTGDGGRAAADRFCELAAHVHAAHAELSRLAAVIERDNDWCGSGLRSFGHWASLFAGLDPQRAADLLRVGQALDSLPRLRAGFESGRLSLDKVKALIAVASPDNEATWCELALNLSASVLAPGTTISATIANEFTEAVSDLYTSALIALGLILFVITFIVLACAQLLLLRLERGKGK